MKGKILITGNNGYIGPVMTKIMMQNDYEVIGLDSNFYENCDFFKADIYVPSKQIVKDIRDITEQDIEGVDAIIHLAALSNDPLGELNPSLTNMINCESSVKIANIAKKIGVERFIFASSCSIYGIADDDSPLDEKGKLNPITAYAIAKVNSEKGISELADDNFHPIFMRNATVYGLSPKLRLDLVVNNLTAYAYLTGKVTILSDGTPWRPLIHVEDFCKAYLAVLEAPVDKIHNHAFNVGQNIENYQVKNIAQQVEEIVAGCKLEILNQTSADERTYRVDFSKIENQITGFKPTWNTYKGIQELYQAYKENKLSQNDFENDKYFRVRTLKSLIDKKALDSSLRFINRSK